MKGYRFGYRFGAALLALVAACAHVHAPPVIPFGGGANPRDVQVVSGTVTAIAPTRAAPASRTVTMAAATPTRCDAGLAARLYVLVQNTHATADATVAFANTVSATTGLVLHPSDAVLYQLDATSQIWTFSTPANTTVTCEEF